MTPCCWGAAPGAAGGADPANLSLGKASEPEITNTGLTDFGITFPNRIHAFLEDVTNQVPKDKLSRHTEELKRINEEEGAEAVRKKIKELITSLKTTKSCPHCNAKQQKITIEKPTTFLESDKRITPIEIRTRLEKIPDEDLNAIVFMLNELLANLK